MEEQKLTVRAVERAMDILLCFTEKRELGLSEISAKVGLHKSTVHRLLASLEGKGFIVRDSHTDKYRLGIRIWELAASLDQTDNPAVLFLPEMERLRDAIGETVSLYIRDGIERIRIQAVQSRQAIRRVAEVGARLPLYVGASSKVLLAFADEDVRDRVLNDPSWPDSVERQAYLAQLEDIRKLGYATSIEERELGAAAVAAPIFNRSGQLAAALSISGPSNRFTLQKMQEIAPKVIESAQVMGKLLR
ncbi:IclR family transcriptional regulator [Insulibacter thermoxylanivorax]|uniref:IclR family transcriptional regulator n=1 Tax=Insulibacter thermoxylanivorax TaxID=2749268 RepID=UPI001910F4B5|nr:IclR family transcriptional regulator [Insulibacter thermoxylanivorax]